MQFEPVTGKKVIAYLRVSTKEQGKKGNGLRDQAEWVDQLIISGKHTLVERVEEVASAGDVLNRPKLQAVIKRVAKDPSLYIIVSKVDRLVRNQLDGHQLLHDVGNRVIFGDIPIAEPMVLAVYFAMAERERDFIKFRTERGIVQARKKRGGKWGNPESLSKEGRLKGGAARRSAAASNANNIRAYELMKGLREKGKGWRSIASSLNEKQFRTSRNNEFSPGSAQDLFIRMKSNESQQIELEV